MQKQSVQAISQNNLFKLICHWAFCQHYSIQSKQQCLKCLHESPRSKKNSKPSLSVSHVIFFALEYLFSALLYLSSDYVTWKLHFSWPIKMMRFVNVNRRAPLPWIQLAQTPLPTWKRSISLDTPLVTPHLYSPGQSDYMIKSLTGELWKLFIFLKTGKWLLYKLLW